LLSSPSALAETHLAERSVITCQNAALLGALSTLAENAPLLGLPSSLAENAPQAPFMSTYQRYTSCATERFLQML